MNISKEIKEFYMKRKNLIINATLLVAFCVAVLLFFLANINTAKAIEVTTTDVEYLLSDDNLELTLSVSQDGVYTIKGDSTQRNNVSIKVVPNSEQVTNVTVIFEDVIITTSEDKPIITFETFNSSNICDYTFKVSGECKLESTCDGAENAIISVQQVNASLVQLKEAVLTADSCKLSDLVYDVEMRYGANLTIKSVNGPQDRLTVITATGSYGAAIGSGEAGLDVDVVLNPGNNNVLFEPYYCLDEYGNPFPNGEMRNAYDYINEKYGTDYDDSTLISAGKEFLIGTTVNAGDITIDDNMEIYILGRGYGAGIGGGGSKSIDYHSGKAGVVTINKGTITICMTMNNAPAIGSGRNSAGGPVSAGNKIKVNGGSLYMEATDALYDGDMINNAGNSVYLYVADLSANGGFTTDWTDVIRLEDEKYTDTFELSMDVLAGQGIGTITSLNPNYVYEGLGHSSRPISGQYANNKLYLYLPSTPVSELIIDNSSFINPSQVITVNQEGVPIAPSPAVSPDAPKSYVTKAGVMVEVKIYDVPDVLGVDKVLINGESYPVTIETDSTGTYYMAAFKMPLEVTTLEVVYAGNITIEYNDGFLDTDTTDHRYSEPTNKRYEYGDIVSLEAPYASDLIFEGWYVTGTNTKVETIRPEDILAGDIITNGVISLTAKWKVEIEYTYQYGTMNEAAFGESNKVWYGEPYQFDPDNSSNPTPPQIPYYDFVSWKIGDKSYVPGSGNVYSVASITSKLTVTAQYNRNRFYIYVHKEFFDAADITLMIGSNTLNFEDGEYDVDGTLYRRVLIEDISGETSLVIRAKYGYELTAADWNVSIVNAAESICLWGDNQVSYMLEMGETDVYVKNNAPFVPKTYTITLYDGLDKNNPWKVIGYKITDVNLPTTLEAILGDAIAEINGRYDRYHAFVGWKANTAMGEDDPYVTQIDSLGNYIFVAQWELVERYPVCITVLDSISNNKSDKIAAMPFLYDSTTGKKTKLDVVEMVDPRTGQVDKFVYVLPGDQLYFEFVALNDDGTYMTTNDGGYKAVKIDEGIHFAAVGTDPYDYMVKLSYVTDAAEDTTKKIREKRQIMTIPDDAKDNGIIYVTMRIGLTSFNIQYWDLRGYDNSTNPLTYTIFDEFEFTKLLEDVDWLLVIPDDDGTNYDDVTTATITGVSKWSTGNLVLKANWPENYDETYDIEINLKDNNGTVQVTFPVESEEYKEKESIILSVIAKPGYRLKKNSLTYTKKTMNSGAISFLPFEQYENTESKLPQVITALDEKNGVYVFMMPASDIVITAEFELEEYSITYSGIDDKVYNNNPSKYTINDSIILSHPTKEGYEFVEWQDQNGNIITKIDGNTGNIELKPIWKIVNTETLEQTTANQETSTNDVGEVETTTNTTENTTTKKPSDDNVPNAGDKPNTGNGSDEDKKPEDTSQEEPTTTEKLENETTTKNQYIGGSDYKDDDSNIKTGDDTNTTRLVLILVCAATLLLLLVVMKKNKSDDENK